MKFRGYVLGCVLFSTLSAQDHFQWRLSSDAGVLQLTDSTSERLLFVNPSLNLRYSDHYARHQFQFQARLRPEFYDGRDRRALLNLGGNAHYTSQKDAVSWNADVAEQRQHFYSSPVTFYVNDFRASAGINWQPTDYLVPQLETRLANVNVTGDIRSDYATQALSGTINIYPRSLGTWSAGAYVERFVIRIPRSQFQYRTNRGNGLGFTSGWEWTHDLTWRLSYRLAFRESATLEDKTTEQQFSIIAGKPLTNRISAFFYLDITTRSSRTDNVIPVSLRIQSGNLENQWYAKLAYEYSDRIEISLKSGFVKYDWFQRSPLSGFQISAGVRSQN